MGTSHEEAARKPCAAPIHRYYSKTSWIEGAAEDQLDFVAGMEGMVSVAAFPDLHPGKCGPVGSAMLSDRLHPQLVGNDIGCGMSLYALDMPARKLRLPKAAQKMRSLEGGWDGDSKSRLAKADLSTELLPAVLGTIGGGNHFCELQVVDTIAGEAHLDAAGLVGGDLVLLVHSGSRAFGASVFEAAQVQSGGLDADSSKGRSYLEAHDEAVRWAALNRDIIAERAATALRCDIRQVCDAPHNLIERRADGFLHRKGAAKADLPLVPLAGSRDAESYLLKPRSAKKEALASLAHGAGRKYDRRSMVRRAGATRLERNNLTRTSFGGIVICEDRQLLIEEAPQAYKDPAQVVADLRDAGLAEPVAELKPLLTFKRAASREDQAGKRGKARRLRDRRRAR